VRNVFSFVEIKCRHNFNDSVNNLCNIIYINNKKLLNFKNTVSFFLRIFLKLLYIILQGPPSKFGQNEQFV